MVFLALLEGTEFYFNDSYIDIIDQYGRPVDYTTISDSFYDVIFWAEDGADNIHADYEPYGDEYLIASLKGGVQGSDTLYLGIIKYKTKQVAPESIYTFTAQVVGLEDLNSYSLDVVDDLLCSDSESWNNYDQILFNWGKMYAEYIMSDTYKSSTNSSVYYFSSLDKNYTPYGSPIVFKAYTEDGTEVSVVNNGSRGMSMGDFIDLLTFTIENVEIEKPMSYEYPLDPTVLARNEVEGTCVAKAWLNGEMVASTTFEISKAAPIISGISAKSDTYDMSLFDSLSYRYNEDFLAQYLYRWETTSESFWEELAIDKYMDSEAGFFILSQFNIVDQYGVELPWEKLYLEGEINIITNYFETADGTDVIVTVMTSNGVYYDSITFTNIDSVNEK